MKTLHERPLAALVAFAQLMNRDRPTEGREMGQISRLAGSFTKQTSIILGIIIVGTLSVGDRVRADSSGSGLELVKTTMIWNAAPHNAFTDLTSFQGRFYCTFREATSHLSQDGRIRIISSVDGNTWESAALMQSTAADLRDPSLTITPSGQLMLSSGMRYNQPVNGMSYQSQVWFSDNGTSWDGGHSIDKPEMWLWKPTWHNGSSYAVGEVGPSDGEYLTPWYKSSDGINWTTEISSIAPSTDGKPTEAATVFTADGTAYTLLRRDEQNALLGTASAAADYTDWTWKDVGVKVGGPALLALPDGRLLGAVRLYDDAVRVSLAWIDPTSGTLTEALTLPSGGTDCGYAGMVLQDDKLWVSYYSIHEGQTRIYLSEVNVLHVPEPKSIAILATGALAFLVTLRSRIYPGKTSR